MHSVAVYSGLAQIPPCVSAFLDASGQEDFFLGTEWFRLLAAHALPAGAVPRIYVVSTGDEIDGVLVCVTVPGAGKQSPNRLGSLTNFYTMSFVPILRRGLADAGGPIGALVAFIARERPRWSSVELRNLVAEEPLVRCLLDEFRRAGFIASTYVQFENWYEPTAGISARDYFASRPSQARNTITRKSKKLEREHKVDIQIARTVDETALALPQYEHVYARSWKLPEAYPAFIPNFVKTAAQKGVLRLGVASIDGAPAAAQIWIVAGGRATIYKLAYDEAFASTSVGSILTKRMFDEVLDKDDVREVDYGVGSERYKLDWMSRCRQGVGLIAFNRWTLPGLFAAARHLAGQHYRRWRPGAAPAAPNETNDD